MEDREIIISERVLGLLRRMPAFACLGDDQIAELFADKGLRHREYRAGETIIRENMVDNIKARIVEETEVA